MNLMTTITRIRTHVRNIVIALLVATLATYANGWICYLVHASSSTTGRSYEEHIVLDSASGRFVTASCRVERGYREIVLCDGFISFTTTSAALGDSVWLNPILARRNTRGVGSNERTLVIQTGWPIYLLEGEMDYSLPPASLLPTMPMFKGFALHMSAVFLMLVVVPCSYCCVRKYQRVRHGKCVECGYRVAGLRAEVCPECGKSIAL